MNGLPKDKAISTKKDQVGEGRKEKNCPVIGLTQPMANLETFRDSIFSWES